MTDERDPEATLEEWKESMQAEHAEAIANPDPDESHEIEAVVQLSYRLSYAYDYDTDTLERAQKQQVDELADPELYGCACGVRGMTAEEARQHMAAARDGQ